MQPWHEAAEQTYKILLEDSKTAWKEKPDEPLLKSIADKMAEYKHKLEIAKKDKHKNRIRFYTNNLEFVSSKMESIFLEKSQSFTSEGVGFLTGVINKIAKKFILESMEGSLKDLSSEERKAIKDNIGSVFDKAIVKKHTINKETIMSKITMEEVASKLEPIMKKITESGDYMGAAMPGIMLAMELVNDVKEMSGDEKKELVVSAFRYAYKKYDPDIPYVSGLTEEIIETYFLNQLLPAAIDALWKASRARFLHKASEEAKPEEAKPEEEKL